MPKTQAVEKLKPLMRPMPEPTTGKFGKHLTQFLSEFILRTIDPWRLDFFFRCLLEEMVRWEFDQDDCTMFLDHVGQKLHDSQGRLRPAIPRILKKYKAVLRISFEERKNGFSSIESQEALAAASREATVGLENIKEG